MGTVENAIETAKTAAISQKPAPWRAEPGRLAGLRGAAVTVMTSQCGRMSIKSNEG
ncbi:hypothetical protein GCM10020358_69850 [Amorphoplanes nipponensis]|uniref:Uncharacterized protein n=1 Tax=Actinoplanes nipponensis TaxID=135950 RepID=A0A919MN19_9ACTN|nr:hypothetical protein Ani05nite_46450 [Actinoplanes nipponensis]